MKQEELREQRERYDKPRCRCCGRFVSAAECTWRCRTCGTPGMEAPDLPV